MHFTEKTSLYSSCDEVFIRIAEPRGPSGRLPSQPVCGLTEAPLTPCLGSSSCQAADTSSLYANVSVHRGRREASESLDCAPQLQLQQQQGVPGWPASDLPFPLSTARGQRRQDKGTLLSAAPVRCLYLCVRISLLAGGSSTRRGNLGRDLCRPAGPVLPVSWVLSKWGSFHPPLKAVVHPFLV